MIGVWLTQRREEFIQFAKNHILLYEDIMDPLDVIALQKYEAVLTDISSIACGSTPVIKVDDTPFEVLLRDYVKFDHEVHPIIGGVKYLVIDTLYDALKVSLTFPEHIVQKSQVNVVSAELERPKYQSLEAEQLAEESFDIADISLEQSVSESDVMNPINGYQSIPYAMSANAYKDPPIHGCSTEFLSGRIEQPQATNVFGGIVAEGQFPAVHDNQGVIRSHGTQKMAVRGMSKDKKRFGTHVVTFSSLSDKAGVSTTAFMFAKMLALQNEAQRVLYLDLNISNPNSILNLMQLNPDTDASVVKIAASREIDFVSNISLLTETVSVADCGVSLITFGEATLMEKSQLVRADFKQFITAIADCFDMVIIDLGRYQATLPYQTFAYKMSMAKHVLVADGSSSRVVNTFIKQIRELPFRFEIVVNKYTPNVGTFQFTQQLKITPIGSITVHRNLEAIMTERIPFEGTSLHSQLISVGGML